MRATAPHAIMVAARAQAFINQKYRAREDIWVNRIKEALDGNRGEHSGLGHG